MRLESSGKQKALIYARVSSKQQDPESQVHRCRKYAERCEYEVEEVFRDKFTGGGDFWKRPEMKRLLQYIDDHPGRRYTVIFDDLKRFARDTEFHIRLRKCFKSRNVRVECLNFNFEESPEGKFVETVLAAQGELEREQNRRQVVQKMRARLERGYWPFFPPPGFKSVASVEHGKLLVPDEPLAAIITEALEGFASGRFNTQTDVQRFLTRRGFYKYVSTRRVHLEQVKRLLTKPIYTGYIEYRPWGVALKKGHHASLISLATYERIQERLKGSVKTFEREDIRSEFPLRGFVLCAQCRRPYTASWSTGRSRKYGYYRCKSSSCAVGNKSIPSEVIHAQFEEVLGEIEVSSKRLNLVQEVVGDVWGEVLSNAEAIVRLRKQEKDDLERKIAVLMKRIENACSPAVVPLYERQVEALMSKQLALEEPPVATSLVTLGTAQEEVCRRLKRPLALWKSEELDDRRWLLRFAFSRPLVYYPKEGFGTAELSLLLSISRDSVGQKSRAVEMVRRSWNQIQAFILGAYSSLNNHIAPAD